MPSGLVQDVAGRRVRAPLTRSGPGAGVGQEGEAEGQPRPGDRVAAGQARALPGELVQPAGQHSRGGTAPADRGEAEGDRRQGQGRARGGAPSRIYVTRRVDAAAIRPTRYGSSSGAAKKSAGFDDQGPALGRGDHRRASSRAPSSPSSTPGAGGLSSRSSTRRSQGRPTHLAPQPGAHRIRSGSAVSCPDIGRMGMGGRSCSQRRTGRRWNP